MPLIKEKIDIGFAGRLSGQTLRPLRNRCVVARNVSRHDATKPKGLQSLFITADRPGYQELYGAITIFPRSRVLKLKATKVL
jgi:hypothetical protein